MSESIEPNRNLKPRTDKKIQPTSDTSLTTKKTSEEPTKDLEAPVENRNSVTGISRSPAAQRMRRNTRLW